MFKNTVVLRKASVLKKVPWSAATLWRKCKSGDFPKPIQLGPNSVGWLESEIDDWIDDQAAKRIGGTSE